MKSLEEFLNEEASIKELEKFFGKVKGDKFYTAKQQDQFEKDLKAKYKEAKSKNDIFFDTHKVFTSQGKTVGAWHKNYGGVIHIKPV